MPGYRDLLDMIRRGHCAEQIVRLMPMRPSHLRRLLKSRRLADALAVERELAAGLLPYRLAISAERAAEGCLNMALNGTREAGRKAAENLMREGRKHLPPPTMTSPADDGPKGRMDGDDPPPEKSV